MPKEFKLPDLGEGIHEGEIVEVLVSEGDNVEDGQPILIIETDKATTEVPSPVTGVVKEIKVQPGDVVNVGEVLMVFTEVDEAEAASEQAGKEEKAAQEKPKKREPDESAKQTEVVEEEPAKEREPKEKPGKKVEPTEKEKPEAADKRKRAAEEAAQDKQAAKGPVPATPSTRRLARELGVDLHQVSPSGPGGRVTAEDVRSFAEEGQKKAEAPAKRPAEEAARKPSRAEAPALPDFEQWGEVERVPLRSIRRATARRMALAWSQIPHVTHEDSADITELEAFRRQHKSEIEAQGGGLSLTVFALKAVVAGLKAHPRFNASLDTESEEIIVKYYYNIGVAVDTDRGLIVPVIKNVDRKSIIELSKELHDLINRIRKGEVDREDTRGGTFTITNIGPLGGTGFAPIVNYPQVGILGLAQARLQPIVRGDEKRFDIVPRLMLPLIVAFDHRVVDGADAARFLNLIVEALESPEKLLMMM